jgi:hypothetical protein
MGTRRDKSAFHDEYEHTTINNFVQDGRHLKYMSHLFLAEGKNYMKARSDSRKWESG